MFDLIITITNFNYQSLFNYSHVYIIVIFYIYFFFLIIEVFISVLKIKNVFEALIDNTSILKELVSGNVVTSEFESRIIRKTRININILVFYNSVNILIRLWYIAGVLSFLM